jgi:carboxypeptidase Taq
METSSSETLQPIINLAKAREVLIMDAQTHIPKGARAQRDKMIATLESVIGDALAATAERLPQTSAVLDPVSQRAWEYVAQKQAQGSTLVPDAHSAYENLKRAFDRRSNLSQTSELLSWAQQTQAPSDAFNAVLEDGMAAVAVFMHRALAQPKVRRWIEEVRASRDTLEDIGQRNFSLMDRQWMESAGLDEKLVEDLSRARSAGFTAWQKAKPDGDFNAWLPYFENVVELTRQKSEILGKEFGTSAYQAALESFNPKLNNETVNQILGELRTKLPGLIKRITDHQLAQEPPLLLPPIPVDVQRRLGKLIMNKLGLEDGYARLDESAHPFSCGQWDDVRVTTHYKEKDAIDGLLSIVHEVGHALYSQSLPKESMGQPIGEAQSMWVHETQSIFWERQMAATEAFMEFLAPILKQEFGVDGPEWNPENLHKLITRVQPRLIRTEADAVTYPAHVILRHDLEQKLIDGSLAPKDVPAAWAKGMKELLGIDVPDHAHGCMQDVHWPEGLIGYFPAYTFGALGAAQLMEKAKQDIPKMDELIRKREFTPIREWLTDKIHRHGSYYSGEKLIENATGKKLSAKPWLDHVERDFLGQEAGAATNWQAKAKARSSEVSPSLETGHKL